MGKDSRTVRYGAQAALIDFEFRVADELDLRSKSVRHIARMIYSSIGLHRTNVYCM